MSKSHVLLPRFSAVVLGGLLLAACSSTSTAPDSTASRRAGPVDYRHYDAVLAKHLSGKGGLFDYAGLLADESSKRAWQAHLAVLAAATPANLPAEDRKAFWLNAYNTFCIEGILRNYPTAAPNEIPGFFDKLTYPVAGRSLTVNQMQYETLMPEFKDARLHFALVCSDFGCPPLEDTAFTGADLEERLTDLSYRFARDGGRFRIDLENKVVYASKLFDAEWYAKDFTGDPARPAADAVQYMAPWLTEAEREFLRRKEYKVEIIPWDWRLNEWKPERAPTN
jgi:hypothetical protein